MMNNGLSTQTYFNRTYKKGVWQHVTVTLSSTTITYYLNGINSGETDGFQTPRNLTRLFNYIGKDNLNPNAPNAKIEIDDLMIFNRSLSQNEVIKVMNSFNTYTSNGPSLPPTYNYFNHSASFFIAGLFANQAIVSNSKQYRAEMRWDGNFVIYVTILIRLILFLDLEIPDFVPNLVFNLKKRTCGTTET
jgi:hypothetical protein